MSADPRVAHSGVQSAAQPQLRPRRGWILRAAAALLLSAGCAVGGPASIPELPEQGSLSEVSRQAIERTKAVYLYPDRLDRRMLIGALDALELRFDPVRFDEGEPNSLYGVLSVGNQSVRVPLDSELVTDRFISVLGRAVDFISRHLGDELREAQADSDEDFDLELIALSGALEALDRYSTVVSGRRNSEDFQIRFSGKLSGIGTRIGREDGKLIAVEVFPDSPAERAGLKSGDDIVLIDQNPTSPLTAGEAVDLIRGEPGTVVQLTVKRTVEGSSQPETKLVPITRGEVNVPSVEARALDGDIGYARIRQVSNTTSQEFYSKVRGLGTLRGLVLDLRGNTGGSMREAAKLADLFLASGTIFRVVDRSGELDARGAATAPASSRVAFRFPVAVLIDPSTASAAEIFSGAIEPLPRVTTIGQTSFGKGLIQSVVPLPENNLLKVTVGEYLLSDDRVIHDKGLKPDIALFPVSRENLGALSARPENSMAYLLPASGDDEAPIEMGRLLLDHGQARAMDLFRERADREIAQALEQAGLSVRWTGGESIQKAQLMQPLLIEGGAPSALRGEATIVSICASNPNRVAVPSAWAALGGLPFLANKLISLGTIEPQQKACGKVEVKPEDGLTSSPVPIEVLVSSGPHPLQTQKVQLLAEDHAPRLQIEVVRSAPQTLAVTLTNSGCCGTGAIRVAVPGALRSLENLAARESKTVELPLTGKARMVNVLVAGIGASQRIDVPVPETRVVVVPPEVRLSQQTVLGKHQLRVTASAPEGLREGWIATSHDQMSFPQKELYIAWEGDAEGQMSADLVSGDNSVTTKVETVSGVAVLDVRNVTTR